MVLSNNSNHFLIIFNDYLNIFGFEEPNWIVFCPIQMFQLFRVLKIDYKSLIYLSISMPLQLFILYSLFYNFTLQKSVVYYIINQIIVENCEFSFLLSSYKIPFSISFKNNGSIMKIIRLTAVSHGSFHQRCEFWNDPIFSWQDFPRRKHNFHLLCKAI